MLSLHIFHNGCSRYDRAVERLMLQLSISYIFSYIFLFFLFLPFLKGEKNREQSAVQLVLSFNVFSKLVFVCVCMCLSVWKTEERNVLSLMHGISLNTLPLMNIFMMLQGAGVKCWGQVCVCTCVAGKKECERGERQAVCTAPKQTSLLSIKWYHVLYLFWKYTCYSGCMQVLETKCIGFLNSHTSVFIFR